jgi:hypothetical protein
MLKITGRHFSILEAHVPHLPHLPLAASQPSAIQGANLTINLVEDEDDKVESNPKRRSNDQELFLFRTLYFC